jgi:hypothetical protein
MSGAENEFDPATKDPVLQGRNQREKAGFTAEAQSSQSFYFQTPPPRSRRIGGEPSDCSDMALMCSI